MKLRHFHFAIFMLLALFLYASCKDILSPSSYEPFDVKDLVLSKNVVNGISGNGQVEIILNTGATVPESSSAQIIVLGVGKFSNGESQKSLTIGPNNEYHFQISAQEVGTATLTISVLSTSSSIDITFIPRPLDIEIEVIRDGSPADNVSEIVVQAKVITTNYEGLAVKFNSTKGTFMNAEMKTEHSITNDSIATAYIKHNRNETAIISVSVLNKIKQIGVTFSRAFPQIITVETETAVIDNSVGANVQVSSHLIRNAGIVTPGTIVFWSDSTEIGISPGVFLNTTPSDDSGKSFAEYHLQDTSFIGNTYLIGHVMTDKGIVRGIGKIAIIKE